MKCQSKGVLNKIFPWLERRASSIVGSRLIDDKDFTHLIGKPQRNTLAQSYGNRLRIAAKNVCGRGLSESAPEFQNIFCSRHFARLFAPG